MFYKWQCRKASGKKGFTLIELIVVIAILVILMALMVPLINKYIKDATDTTEMANARAVYAAAAAWAAGTLANGGTICDSGKTLTLTNTGTELKEYFSTTGSRTYSAVVDSNGRVISATYGTKTYRGDNNASST